MQPLLLKYNAEFKWAHPLAIINHFAKFHTDSFPLEKKKKKKNSFNMPEANLITSVFYITILSLMVVSAM